MYKIIKNWNHIEQDLYNTLLTNHTHTNCSLIIKCSYNNPYQYALYCNDHDMYLKWISHDQNDILLYKKLHINQVIYPDDDLYHFGSFNEYTHPWAFDSSGIGIHKTIKVKNYRTGKLTKLWVAFQGNKYRDPSLAEYWEFIDSFK